MIRHTNSAPNLPRKCIPHETLLAAKLKEAFERAKAKREPQPAES